MYMSQVCLINELLPSFFFFPANLLQQDYYSAESNLKNTKCDG